MWYFLTTLHRFVSCLSSVVTPPCAFFPIPPLGCSIFVLSCCLLLISVIVSSVFLLLTHEYAFRDAFPLTCRFRWWLGLCHVNDRRPWSPQTNWCSSCAQCWSWPFFPTPARSYIYIYGSRRLVSNMYSFPVFVHWSARCLCLGVVPSWPLCWIVSMLTAV